MDLFCREVIEIERAIVFLNFGPADGGALFLEREPGETLAS